jgi:hypothetical protein
MASPEEIVAELMSEIGKSSPDVQKSLEDAVGDVTIDLLSQNEGRFEALRRDRTITIDTTKTQYKLPSDVNAVIDPAYRQDVSGETLTEINILGNEADYFYRVKNPTQYPASNFARVKYLDDGSEGPAYYLIFSSALTEAGSIVLEYYRHAKSTDTDKIRNKEIVKAGVRAKRGVYWPADGTANITIYFRMREGFREDPTAKATRTLIMLPARKMRHNTRQWRIGRGY